MVVFRQRWFYSGKSGCIRDKVVVIVQSGSIRAIFCIPANAVVIGQKVLYSGISGCNWAK